MEKFRTIYADPPWKYSGRGPVGNAGRGPQDGRAGSIIQGGADEHYGTMSIGELRSLPVIRLAEDNAHLYLWTTNSFICEAHEIAKAWGFTPKTIITWGKVQENGAPSRKTGYYFRSATEHCLFAVRGSLPLSTKKAEATLFLHHRLPHSVKPEAFIDLIERCSPGPYLELFARRVRLGWKAWGNEVVSDISL